MITHLVIVDNSVFINRHHPIVSPVSLTSAELKELRYRSIFDKSQNSKVIVVPRIQAEHLRKDHGSICGGNKKFLSYPKYPDQLQSLQASCSVGTKALSPRCEAYHLHPFSAKLQNQ